MADGEQGSGALCSRGSLGLRVWVYTRTHVCTHTHLCAPMYVCCRLFRKASLGHSGLERNGPEGEWAGSDRSGTEMDKEEGQNEVRKGGTGRLSWR